MRKIREILRLRYEAGLSERQIAKAASVTSNTVYGYDLAGRLATVTKDGALVESYSYDANGNRVGGTYDNQDRLLAYGANTYTWTANGDLQTKTTALVGGASAATAFAYDPYGNLKSATLPDGTRLDYLTDGRHRRIGKQVNGTTVQAFLYQDQLRIAAELDGSNNVVSRFVYGTKINVPEYMQKGGNTYRIVTDHLGSVRLVVDTVTGTIAQRMDDDSFGNVTSDTSPGFKPFGFAGGLYDADTKLVRFGARDYDAETGRWTAKDPIGFEGGDANVYAYVSGNPISSIDPTGLKTFGECETGGFFREARQQFLPDAIKNHGPSGKYDFAYGPNRNDTWTISGRTYNSHEFGNVLAGYTGGVMFGETFGSALVMGAGIAANIGDNGWTGGDLDASSRPYIALGAKLGAADSSAAGSWGSCGCGGQ